MTAQEFHDKYALEVATKTLKNRAKYKLKCRFKLPPRPQGVVSKIKRRWTDEEITQLIELYKTMSCTKVSKVINIHRSLVFRKLKELGIVRSEEKTREIWLKSHHDSFTPERRAAISKKSKGRKLTEEHKAKLALARQRNRGKISKVQQLFYNICRSLDINIIEEGNPECAIGPFTFDAVIVHDQKKILAEVQGQWVHARKEVLTRDKAKATYIKEYFPEYEVAYFYEREFACQNEIADKLKLLLNHDPELIQFDFDDVAIELCDHISAINVLDSYYNVGKLKRGLFYKVTLNNDIIATMICARPAKSRITKFYGTNKIIEIRRIYIKHRYRIDGFKLWLLQRLVELVDEQHRTLIVVTRDQDYIHDLEKVGFTFDREYGTDYYYLYANGYVIINWLDFAVSVGDQFIPKDELIKKHNLKLIRTSPKKIYIKNLRSFDEIHNIIKTELEAGTSYMKIAEKHGFSYTYVRRFSLRNNLKSVFARS